MRDEPAEIAQFREEVRSWFDANTPRTWRADIRHADEQTRLQFSRQWAKALHSAGFLVPHWPTQFGGGGRSALEQIVIEQEMTRADAPRQRYQTIALGHAAATLIEHGSPEQQALLSGILGGAIWCQGFSEPNAGSDLAALQTRADWNGEAYVVNGQKTWSSMAHLSSWCLLLARTDREAPKHRGISLFLLDMQQDGVEIRPIKQATGSSEFCELFLTDVVIPSSRRVGPENEGWRLAQTTLTTERISQMIGLHQGLQGAIDILATQVTSRSELAPELTSELARAAAEVEVMGMLTNRLLDQVTASGSVGPESSIIKLFYSELLQRLTRIGSRIGGMDFQIDPQVTADLGYTSGDWLVDYIRSWTWTIAAGSNEIQRNIIAERILGLPREPVIK